MPLTVATPRVKPVEKYEEPFFKAPPSPDVSNLLETGTMVSKTQVQEAEELGGAARSLLAGVLHKKAELEHGMAITAATRSIGELDAKLDDLNKEYIDRLDGTNTPQISDELSTKRKEIIEEHRTALKDNPTAYNFFERHLPSTERSHIKSFVDRASVVDSNSAEIGLRAYVGTKVKSVSPASFINDDKDLMSAALENTLIKPEDRPRKAREAREQLADGMFDLYTKDPKLVGGFLELMKSENKAFDSIDPNKQGEKVTFSEAFFERANPTKDYRGLLKTAAKGQVITDADTRLKTAPENINEDGTFNYPKMIQSLSKPDVRKGLNLTAEQGAHLQNILKAEESYQMTDEAQRNLAIKNEELDKAGNSYAKGDMKAAINIVKNSKVIEGKDKPQILRSFGTPMPEGRSNVSAYLALQEKMYDPNRTTEQKKIDVLQARGITTEDKKELGKIGLSVERKAEKVYEKAGLDLLSKTMLPAGLEKNPITQERLKNAQATYRDGIIKFGDKFRTPQDYIGYAAEISQMPQYKFDQREDMKAGLKALRGEGIAPATTPKKKMVYDSTTGTFK